VGVDPPATSTVHEALKRNYLVAPHPPRRRRARIRFEREISNDLWQIDATRVLLADESPAWVIDLLDDHARYLVGASAVAEVTAEAAWLLFARAAALHGLPRQLLSDNGLCFTGRLHGVEVLFEQRLAKAGVQMINSAPYHPETLGKLERFHRTLKEWLHDEGPARGLVGLQELLDRFREHYNLERPHQGIADLTPAERYRLGFEIVHGSQPPISHEHPVATQANHDKPPSYPPYSILRKVSTNGELSYKRLSIQVGSRWNGATLRVVEVGELIHVYHGPELIRALAPDRTKRTQTLGRPPGARRPRLRT
jgi:transposase InsO family protein